MTYYGDNKFMAPSLGIGLFSHHDIRKGFVEFEHSGLDWHEYIGYVDEYIEKMLEDEERW
jgi:hypothetical protein